MFKVNRTIFEYMIIIIFSIISFTIDVQAAEGCVTSNCSALGFTQTTDECKGRMMIKCPFDLSKVNCNTGESTCGDKFYGIVTCPNKATCVSCVEGNKIFQKSITCEKDYAFSNEKWTCEEDRCPDGYKRNAADCGTTGLLGWKLSGTPIKTPAGNSCYACIANYCSNSEYPHTNCDSNGCISCTSGDDIPRYKCGSQQTYISSKCLYTVAKNGTWDWVGPGACCSYPTGRGYTEACYSFLRGKLTSAYPYTKAEDGCGKFYPIGNDIYYDYL